MSEQNNEQTQNTEVAQGQLKLEGLYAFKIGMISVYGEDGTAIPVTALKYDPMIVTQVKTKEKDGYEAVQVSFKPKKAKTSSSAELGHMRKAGFENSAYFSREIRQALPEGVTLGQKVALESLEKGQAVKITSKSKGRGFAGTVKRYNFGGGPAAHGSKFHRQPGSSGMRTWPGRILKGRKMPGHMGDEGVTVKGLTIVDVIPEENVLLVKGCIPGAMNTLVKVVKE